ncbi:MAG TPA: allantoinase AllB [Lacipirellulaceae bacterium]|nr:allantoinase AllB [Lacipirellulaceae bacterium]
MAQQAIISSRVVTPEAVRAAAVIVRGERIEAIVRREDVPEAIPRIDLGDLVVSPGLVDSHVHINEPGRADWEGFETATRAAAAGGVTTLVDMPLNSSPVTTTVEALDAKRRAAEGKCWVDVGFHGGLVPGNLGDVEPLLDAGVCGVKAFMCDSGLPEFPATGEAEFRAVLPLLARRGAPLLVHAEVADSPDGAPRAINGYHDWLASRPREFERVAVELLRRLATEFQAPIHVVHLASGPLASHFFWAKFDGAPLTVETCPHYLHFYAAQLRDADPRFKCAPPIREKEDRDRLWEALLAGTIDTIGSDHSPCPPAMKYLDPALPGGGDWQRAWGGISSVELTLPVVWRGLRNYLAPFTRLAAWTAANPARLCGLERKGRLAAGNDADLCVWDPSEQWTVEDAALQQRHKLTPYGGQRVRGRVKRTYVRGRLVYDEGTFPHGPSGELLRRSGAAGHRGSI